MKYLQYFEYNTLRKLIGKYIIIKSTLFSYWDNFPYLLIYIVPNTWSGPIYQEYTIFVVASYEKDINIYLTDEDIKNNGKINYTLVEKTTLDAIEKDSLYIAKNYNDGIEHLKMINYTKYNL